MTTRISSPYLSGHDRADPVKLLVEQDTVKELDLVPVRQLRLSVSHTFVQDTRRRPSRCPRENRHRDVRPHRSGSRLVGSAIVSYAT